jgi:hypothetical protein
MKLLKTLSLGKGLSRRQLLKTLGMSAAAMPLMPTLSSWAAATSPKRLLMLFSSSGTVPELWWPTGTETAWEFPKDGSLEPLNPHKGDLILLKNLPRGASGGGGHEQSMGGLWTGNSCVGSAAQAASVDQIIAGKVAKVTDFQSYPFGVMCFYAGEGDITSKIKNQNPYMIHAGKAQKIASECDPSRTFMKLFGDGKPTTDDPAAAARLQAQKKSIIDALKEEFVDVQTKVSREDKLRIGSHLDSIRDIERRLGTGGAKMMGAVPKPDGTIALDRTANYPMLIDITNKLVVAALASDRTRIASLQYSRGFSQIRHTWAGAKDAHHTLSHMTTQKTVLANIQRFYATQFSNLITQMKAVNEGGTTLFDNTLCVYSNELAVGWTHSCTPGATWWATGAASKFQGALKGTGRFLDFNGSNDYNQMLQTMCKLMGADVDKVGDFGKPGVIPALLA